MNNEELIKRNLEILNNIKVKDFLEKNYFKAYDRYREEDTINLLKTQKSYLEKYKKDYESYFIIDSITEKVIGFWFLWVLVGLVVILTYIFSSFTEVVSISLKVILTIIGSGFIAPTVLCALYSIIKGKNIYGDYLNNLTTKLEIIKNDRLEKGLIGDKEEVNKDKKINDSFVKMIKDTITKIKSLEYAGQKNDLLKIKEIAEEYFAIIRKEIELDDVVNLTTNEDIINLQKRLIEIENDAIAKAKIESDESALDEAFGVDITKLDTSIVELDTGLEGPKLSRNLGK